MGGWYVYYSKSWFAHNPAGHWIQTQDMLSVSLMTMMIITSKFVQHFGIWSYTWPLLETSLGHGLIVWLLKCFHFQPEISWLKFKSLILFMRLDLDDERFIHHITKQHNRFPVLLWVIFYKYVLHFYKRLLFYYFTTTKKHFIWCSFPKEYPFKGLKKPSEESLSAHCHIFL